MKKCELLAPAGGKEALIAAVQNGADAVYFGGAVFSARAGAENFASVAEAVAYCHLRGVRAYLAVNTLVSDREMPALGRALAEAGDAGVDALIVQDIAVAARTAELAPGVALHLSTQGGVIGRSGALFAMRLGFERVVLARECSLADVRAVADTGIGAEVFVHGALCVSYSGRCLFSSMLGGRSGNRGRCAQPCRLPYRTDGGGNGRKKPPEDFGRPTYPLSPRDLCLLGEIPRLIEAGASALKIEGRMRRPEYVALATRAYRAALDAALAGTPYDARAGMNELYDMFNRGAFTKGYALGDNDAALMNPERPNHGGARVGDVGAAGIAYLARPLVKGDSVECRPSGEGFAVGRDWPAGTVKLGRGRRGDALYRTNDAALMERARATYAEERRAVDVDVVLKAVPDEAAELTIADAAADAGAGVSAGVGTSADMGMVAGVGAVAGTDATGAGMNVSCAGAAAFAAASAIAVTAVGEAVGRAENRALTREEALRRIEKTDGAPLRVRGFRLIGEGAYMSAATLNALRREAVALWTAAHLKAARPSCHAAAAAANGATRTTAAAAASAEEADYAASASDAPVTTKAQAAAARPADTPLLIAQTSDPDCVEGFLRIAAEVYFAPLDWRPDALAAAIRRLPETGVRLLLPFWLESPWLEAAVGLAGNRGFAVGSFAAVEELTTLGGSHDRACRRERGAAGSGFVTDYTLHAFSAAAAGEFRALGAERVTLSPELTLAQMRAAAAFVPCEAVIHGDMQLMTLRHCPTRAAAGLSAAGREGCALCGGRPRPLTDRMGVRFPLRRVMAADGCRVELLNAHTLYMLDRMEQLADAGLAALRVVTDEAGTLHAYAAALAACSTPHSITRTNPIRTIRAPSDPSFPAVPDVPAIPDAITRGHFFKGVD